jgi:hypothetical protein
MKRLFPLAISARNTLGFLGAILAFGTANAKINSQSPDGATTIELGIEGYIKPHCAIQLDPSIPNLNLSSNVGKYTQSFGVNCNQRLHVEMRSLNGALVHSKNEDLSHNPKFSDRINYRLEFSVAAPGASTLSAYSQDMFEDSVSGSIGTIPYKTKGNLHFSWSSEKPLLAGEYGDVIEIRVSGDGGMKGRS